MAMDELKYVDGKFTVNGAEVPSADDVAIISANTQQFSVFEDLEGRTEITTDAEDKILGYRDSEGTRHEYKISAKHLELSDEAANEVNDAFKSAGIKMENPSDFSKDNHIELPIPRIAAQVRLYAPKLPTTKQDDIEAEIEYNDKDGNYFKKKIILNAQGDSSMGYHVKNMAIDINDGSEIKFGDFPTQDSFHLKKYYIDVFRGQCIVGYWLMEQIYKSRPIGQQYPYEYSYLNNSATNSLGDLKKDFFTGAKCHPDGFPIWITFENSLTGELQDMGIYTWNLKKHRDVYYCNKKKSSNIILDGKICDSTVFGGEVDWTAFEIRNPKSLIDINGNSYDGDNPKELSDSDATSKTVKEFLSRLSGVNAALESAKTKETFESYFLVNPFIDYLLLSYVIYNFDGFEKNWIWCTWDGNKWTPTAYDLDSIFGQIWNGTGIFDYSNSSGLPGYQENHRPACVEALKELYVDDIKTRYRELRDIGIFDADNIISLLNKWLVKIGYDNLVKELSIYPETPSYRDGSVTYTKFPETGGFFNSPKRVYNWLINRLDFLDTYFNYNK